MYNGYSISIWRTLKMLLTEISAVIKVSLNQKNILADSKFY